MYEPSIRVPLIVVDPRLPAENRGRQVDAITLNIDLAPTLLDYAGIAVARRDAGAQSAAVSRGGPEALRRRPIGGPTFSTSITRGPRSFRPAKASARPTGNTSATSSPIRGRRAVRSDATIRPSCTIWRSTRPTGRRSIACGHAGASSASPFAERPPAISPAPSRVRGGCLAPARPGQRHTTSSPRPPRTPTCCCTGSVAVAVT